MSGLTKMIIEAGQDPNNIHTINQTLLGISQTLEYILQKDLVGTFSSTLER